jgi:RimJ/RimL family protein N-acetyltransferase
VENMVLSGKRVRLRDWMLSDLEEFSYWLQPGHRWQELDAPYYKKTTSEAVIDTITRIRARIETGNVSTPRQNLIIAEPNYNGLIGQVSRYWISEETNWLAAGIVIYNPVLWGRGYGTEALSLWTDYLFDSFPNIVRLDLQTWSGNTAMMRLASKLGYRLEGCFRNARVVGGAYYDALGYGVLRQEWRERHSLGLGQ